MSNFVKTYLVLSWLFDLCCLLSNVHVEPFLRRFFKFIVAKPICLDLRPCRSSHGTAVVIVQVRKRPFFYSFKSSVKLCLCCASKWFIIPGYLLWIIFCIPFILSKSVRDLCGSFLSSKSSIEILRSAQLTDAYCCVEFVLYTRVNKAVSS